MEFYLIDYSERYYSELKGTGAPPDRTGKFVQIREERAEYLVLSPREYSYYHANIVEIFFLSKGIVGRYNAKGDVYEMDHPDWTIVGGGTWTMDGKGRELRLLGSSEAYGKFDPEGLKQRIESLKEMSGYRVRVSKR
jgi:hypothetical protein